MEIGKDLLSNSIILIVGTVVAIIVGMLNLLKNPSFSILLALLIVVICMQIDIFRRLSNLSRRMEAHDVFAKIALSFSKEVQKIFGRKIASIKEVEKAREEVVGALNAALVDTSIDLIDKIKLKSLTAKSTLHHRPEAPSNLCFGSISKECSSSLSKLCRNFSTSSSSLFICFYMVALSICPNSPILIL